MRLLGIPAAAALLFAPTAAGAQSCYELRRQNNQINTQIARLGRDNPGSAVVFATCGLVGMQKYRETGDQSQATLAGGACAAALCLATDEWGNCARVNGALLVLAIASYNIFQRANAIGCRL